MVVKKIEDLFIDYIKYTKKGLTEIMVNPDGKLFVEISGKMSFTGDVISVAKRDHLLRNLAGLYDRVITEKNPALSLRLPNSVFKGGRFQGLYPPVVSAPSFVIRVPSGIIYSLDEFVLSETVTMSQRKVLEWAVLKRKNILVVGGTGSGKTTFAISLLALIKKERVIVIEDDPEIVCVSENVLFMETDVYTSVRDCIFYSLRLRPDRIIVGEIRDGKTAVELVQAWLTGHPGGIATLHASSAQGAKNRLFSLMKQVYRTPSMEDINDSIDYIIFIAKDGNKRVVKTLFDAKNNVDIK